MIECGFAIRFWTGFLCAIQSAIVNASQNAIQSENVSVNAIQNEI